MALLSPPISVNTCLLQHGICNALDAGSSLGTIHKSLQATSTKQSLRTLLFVPNTPDDPLPDVVVVGTLTGHIHVPLDRNHAPPHVVVDISEKGASSKAYHFPPCSLQISPSVQVSLPVNPLRKSTVKLTALQQTAIFEQLLANSHIADFNPLPEIASDINLTLETLCATRLTSLSPTPQIEVHIWLVFNFVHQPDATPLQVSIGRVSVGTTQVPLLSSNSYSTIANARSLLIRALSFRTSVQQTPSTEIATTHQLAPGLITITPVTPLSVGNLLSNWGKLRLNVGDPLLPPPVLNMLKASHTDTGATTPFARVDLLDPYVPEDPVPTYPDQLQRYHSILQTLIQAHWLPMLTC